MNRSQQLSQELTVTEEGRSCSSMAGDNKRQRRKRGEAALYVPPSRRAASSPSSSEKSDPHQHFQERSDDHSVSKAIVGLEQKSPQVGITDPPKQGAHCQRTRRSLGNRTPELMAKSERKPYSNRGRGKTRTEVYVPPGNRQTKELESCVRDHTNTVSNCEQTDNTSPVTSTISHRDHTNTVSNCEQTDNTSPVTSTISHRDHTNTVSNCEQTDNTCPVTSTISHNCGEMTVHGGTMDEILSSCGQLGGDGSADLSTKYELVSDELMLVSEEYNQSEVTHVVSETVSDENMIDLDKSSESNTVLLSLSTEYASDHQQLVEKKKIYINDCAPCDPELDTNTRASLDREAYSLECLSTLNTNENYISSQCGITHGSTDFQSDPMADCVQTGDCNDRISAKNSDAGCVQNISNSDLSIYPADGTSDNMDTNGGDNDLPDGNNVLLDVPSSVDTSVTTEPVNMTKHNSQSQEGASVELDLEKSLLLEVKGAGHVLETENKSEKVKKTKKKDKLKKKSNHEDRSSKESLLPDNTSEILDSIFTSSVVSGHSSKKTKTTEKKLVAAPAKVDDTCAGEVDDWEDLFDENGQCLDDKLMNELTTAVGKVKVESPQFDYLNYQPKEPDLDANDYNHLIEISGFPSEFQTADILSIFNQFMGRGFDLKWVDDTHAIGVFSSSIAAEDALRMKNPFITVCPITMATQQTKMKAKKCTEFLQPYKPRPETTASAARRLVAGALGIKSGVPREKREEERQKLKEARDKKKSVRKMKEATWDGDVGRCAMDEN